MNQFICVVLKDPETIINGESFSQLTIREAIFAYIVVIAATLLAGKLTYWLIEKPFRERSRAFAFKKNGR
jgi:peptidoglycan/LPS O-acetylase OafA/YrhL